MITDSCGWETRGICALLSVVLKLTLRVVCLARAAMHNRDDDQFTPDFALLLDRVRSCRNGRYSTR